MKIRLAKIADAKEICNLITFYAEQDLMLFRSLAYVYENLRSFIIAEQAGKVIGCCALQIIWSDLAEVKSLAVDESYLKKGVGKKLVKAIVVHARELGIPKVFALTLVPGFFQKLGFKIVSKNSLPMKVWSDCTKCPKQRNCDETAVVKRLRPKTTKKSK